MIFQDPYASLDPRMTVGQIIAEPIDTFGLARGEARRARVRELMATVGLNERFINRYPHEFSGGQQQRVGIARSLAADPDFIVADEPISALDVSIQAQIINLIERLQRERRLTYLFISHDLRAIRHTSTRIAVMYLGKIVELGAAHAVYDQPLMPYTKALISAVPVPDPAVERQRKRTVLQGDVPSPLNPPPGCRFHTRCPYAVDAGRPPSAVFPSLPLLHHFAARLASEIQIGLPQLVEIRFLELLEIQQLVTRMADRADQFVQLHLRGFGVLVLRALNQEDHEEGDDRGAGIDDELPGIAVVEQRTGHRPGDDDDDGEEERGGATTGERRAFGKPREPAS
jgi:oligopeptide/dipeptide ABC transporter ATP-binding protein